MDIINDVQSNYSTGFFAVFRSITKKGWYKKSEYVHLWIHLLSKANHKPKEWFYKNKPFNVNRGQFISSRKSLSEETGISQSKVERILKCFQNEQQIEQQNMFTNRLISICNYDLYQISEQQNEQQVNSKRTASEQQVNTNNNVKNIKNEEKEYIYSKFYDSEIEKSTNPKYQKFVKYLFGDNMLKTKLIGILSIRDQLKESEFELILQKCELNKIKLGDILTKIENDVKYYKGKKSLYRTLLNWSEGRFIK